MLALGAALGGLATEYLGADAVFAIDSFTYLSSAFFIYRTVIPQDTEEAETAEHPVRIAYKKIAEGWDYMRHVPNVGRIALAKATWAVGGGATVYMLTLLGEEMMPEAQAAGIGILFFARGFGTGVGPVFARALFKDQRYWPAVLGMSVAISGAFYLTLGFSTWMYGVLLAVVFAHAASGANWVLATVLLQQRAADRLRGRVFASEWLLVLFTESMSILAASVLLETGAVDLRTNFIIFAFVQVACGSVWMITIVPRERVAVHPHPGA